MEADKSWPLRSGFRGWNQQPPALVTSQWVGFRNWRSFPKKKWMDCWTLMTDSGWTILLKNRWQSGQICDVQTPQSKPLISEQWKVSECCLQKYRWKSFICGRNTVSPCDLWAHLAQQIAPVSSAVGPSVSSSHSLHSNHTRRTLEVPGFFFFFVCAMSHSLLFGS